MDERVRYEVGASRLLAALPPESRARLQPHLEPVELVRRQLIYAPGQEAAAGYFINRGLGSLVKSMRDGRVVEVGAVGVEGAVCLSGLLGLPEALLESLVLLPG